MSHLVSCIHASETTGWGTIDVESDSWLYQKAWLPGVGEEAVGEDEPSLLVALDVVGPLQQPALEMLWIGHLLSSR